MKPSEFRLAIAILIEVAVAFVAAMLLPWFSKGSPIEQDISTVFVVSLIFGVLTALVLYLIWRKTPCK